ncbi:MAG TPA: TonB-dependent receptor [Gemmatimonadaceae bacterium]|nr:TonB-dependent receptor [Gemmatimonadaceae bacterium]
MMWSVRSSLRPPTWARFFGGALLLILSSAAAAFAQGTGTVTGTVSDAASGTPLYGVSVFIAGTTVGTTTGGDGSYRLVVPAGRYELRTRLVGFELQRDSLEIAAGQSVLRNFALRRAAIGLSEIVVLGTRRAEERTVLESPVPVDVLSVEDLRSTGRVETNQMIQLLAPSFNFPRASIADGTDHVRPSTLRGLNPDQVLVLINGKRRHTSALVNVNGTIGRGSTGVDLNAIPAAAIDRIEILRDGAAAQYGSDAIAGVLNVVLKSTAESEISSTLGQARTDDGTLRRTDGMVRQVDLNYGLLRSAAGHLNLSAEFRDREQTNRSLPDTRQQYFAGDLRNDDPALTNLINHRQGDGDARDIGAFVNFGRRLSSTTEVYSFSGVTFRRGEAAGFFRRALDDRTVRSIHPDGFLPLINTHIWDGSVAAGVRGAHAGWTWDASTVYGRNTFDFTIKNSNNVSMGTSSPTTFYAGELRFDQVTANLDVARPFEMGLPSTVNLALGAEVRRDGYGITRGDEDSYRDGGVAILDGPSAGNRAAVGAQVFPGFKPTDEQDADRTNVAAYVDLETNLSRQVLVALAGRTEHYSDFGSTTNGKLAIRVEPVERFAIRGAYSTGFRAPSLGQSYFSSTATNFIVVGGVNTPFDIRTFPVVSEEAQILGAQELRPETSRNASFGVAWQPIRRLSLTADFYRIEIDDRIVLSGNFIGDDIQALLESRGFAGVRGGRFFTNAIDTRTDGVDLIVQSALAVGSMGESRFTAGYNHNKSRVTRIATTPPQLGDRQEVLFDRVERARIEEGQPRDNLHLNLVHSFDAFGVNLATARYGAVTVRGTATDGTADQTYGRRWITDFGVSYRLRERFTVSAGADNIFDEYPERNIAPISNAGIFPYNGISPFGFNGRFIYVRGRIGLP